MAKSAEWKVAATAALATDMTTTTQYANLGPIAQGVTLVDRIGQAVLAKSLYVDITINQNDGQIVPVRCRYGIVWSKFGSTTPTTADVWTNTTVPVYEGACRNPYHQREYIVTWDRRIVLQPYGLTPSLQSLGSIKLDKYFKKLNRRLNFATIASGSQELWTPWLFWTSDEGTADYPTISYCGRLRFIDV